MENNYTVYMHTCPNGKRYVGITRQNVKRRWNNGLGYKENEYFSRSILKYGWNNFEHEILFENLTQEEAEQKEIELIAFYQSNIRKYGYNIENGGKCVGTVSEETKTKLSKAALGRKHTEKTKQICRSAVLGKKSSDETRAKLSKMKQGKPILHFESYIQKQRRSIKQFNSAGEYIKIHESLHSASKELNIAVQNISKVLTGKRNTAGGFIWKYAEDEAGVITKNPREKSWKKLSQYDINGNFIRQYNSQREAVEKTGIAQSNISRVCNGVKKSAGGFIWKYAEVI